MNAKSIIEKYWSNRKQIYLLILNFSKAFVTEDCKQELRNESGNMFGSWLCE